MTSSTFIKGPDYLTVPLKTGLTEINEIARDHLERFKREAANDTKLLYLKGYVNEDSLLGPEFKALESEIGSLQLESLSFSIPPSSSTYGTPGITGPYFKHPFSALGASSMQASFSLSGSASTALSVSPIDSLVPGAFTAASNEVSLWTALQMQYDFLLRTTINESLEDALRVSVASLWDADLAEWEININEYEKSIDTQWSLSTGTAGLTGYAPELIRGGDGRRTVGGAGAVSAISTPFTSRRDLRSGGIMTGSGSARPFLRSWEQTLTGSEFQKFLPGSAPVDGSFLVCFKTTSVSPNERLLINLLNQKPDDRNLVNDKLADLVTLSCESIGKECSEFRTTCTEIWDIIISLCGVTPKLTTSKESNQLLSAGAAGSGLVASAESGSAASESAASGSAEDLFRCVVHNAIRCLEDLSCRQLLHQIGILNETQIDDPEVFLTHLCKFCSNANNEFPKNASDFWQLLYWTVRCGALNTLSVLINEVYKYKHLFPVEDFDIFIDCSHLLIEKLLQSSRSPSADQDSVWHRERIHSVRFAPDVNNLFPRSQRQQQQPPQYNLPNNKTTIEDLINFVNSLHIPIERIHSTLPILLSILNPGGPSVVLQEYMPNATAEDFLWFGFHVSSLKSSSFIHQSIVKLQNSVFHAGPRHFEASLDRKSLIEDLVDLKIRDEL